MKNKRWLLMPLVMCLLVALFGNPPVRADCASPFTKASYDIRAEANDSNGGKQTPWATVYIAKDGTVKDALNTLTGTFDFGTRHIQWGGTHTSKVGNTTVTTTYNWDGELRQTGPGKLEGSGTYTYSASTGLTASGTWKVMSVTLFP